MVKPWLLWTDGSCKHVGARGTEVGGLVLGDLRPRELRPALRGPGGWAAVVEHGSDGYIVKGREERTTNVRMELLAAVMALREVPDGEQAILYTDCTTVLVVEERARLLRIGRSPDAGLWRMLAAELERVRADLRFLERDQRDYRHERAHLIAGSEATCAYLGYDPPLGPRVRLALGHSVVARV